ncbi:helicase RepA family protein [Streptomyces sp. NBC_01261]|uniref:AAA family ATPase n=1 Tax=Streptomyces sp. NBC_01261 TaxID=2903802 RepID=UPI002E373EC2|nr:AAA family ATPase [Streptomyces sp. NBC_01261]
MTVLQTYDDLQPDEKEVSDAIWDCYKEHAPELYAKLKFNTENHQRPYHCGREHDENDLSSHTHDYWCTAWPTGFKEQFSDIVRKDNPSPFAGYLHNSDSLDALPQLEPLLEGMLYKGTLARMVGHSGGMKSFVCLDLVAAMGWMQPWHGLRTRSTAVKSLYVVAEGAEGIRARKTALERHYGRKLENVTFFTRAIQIDSEAYEWRQFTQVVKSGGYDLVVLDTQARCSVGMEENSNREAGQLVATLDRLIQDTGASVLLVHHSTGDQSTTGGTLKGRGAGAIRAALQTEIFVRRDRKANLITVTTDKSKDDAERKVVLEPQVKELDGLSDYWGDPLTSVVLIDAVPRIKGLRKDEPAVGSETVEAMAERFHQTAPDKTPTVVNVREVLGVRQAKAMEVARFLREAEAA